MIDKLIKISKYYGKKEGYALGGGGNTSFKNDKFLWVKASGYSLTEITEDGFAVLNRETLKLISKKIYSNNPFEREHQVKNDLMEANAEAQNIKRPSVEASLHDLIEHNFVVHTHPFVVNALMCSQKAKEITLKLFAKTAIFVPYVDPGYILFKRIEKDLIRFKARHKTHPNIIFLQNHGVFVAADTVSEIKLLYNEIFDKLKKYFKKELILNKKSFNYTMLPEIKKIYLELIPGPSQIFRARQNPLIDFFVSNKKNFSLIKKPFIPDQIVYCKTNPIWIDQADKNKPAKIYKKFKNYFDKFGYLPRIILIEKEGIIGIEINDQSARLVLDVFEDAMKISYYSLNFGGPHFMTNRQIQFIESWEVENYRRNLLVK